jgi:hypothetical protein
MAPFVPKGMTAEQVKDRCVEARKSYYAIPSILRRGLDLKVNGGSPFMWFQFFAINLLFRSEVLKRKDFPLGDESYAGPLLKVDRHRCENPGMTETALQVL